MLKHLKFAVLALLCAPLVYERPAIAQSPPLTFEVLAAGFSPERRVRLQAKGPSDILQTRIVIQPGGDTGWHTHPGPVVTVVKAGTGKEYHGNGCTTVHEAGSVFFEAPGHVHRVVNEGTVPVEAYATFIIPHGVQPLLPAADPGSRTCRPDRDRHHDGDHDRD